MVSRFRTALMWLLLLALPLQGIAAATMLHCGPSHHGMMASMEPMVAAPADPHRHAVDGEAQHATGTAHDHHGAAASGEVGREGISPHQLSDLSKFKCSACASCCVGTALPAAAIVFESFAPAIAPALSVAAEPIAFFTDGPDRPPRLLLA